MITIVCAGFDDGMQIVPCGLVIGQKDSEGAGDGLISHSQCPNCKKKQDVFNAIAKKLEVK